jgi:hypothetical protein
MHQQLLKKIDEIKNHVRGLEDDSVTTASLDSLYDKLIELEELVYEHLSTEGGDEDTDYYD